MTNKKALVSASGGLDSTTILYWLHKQNYDLYVVSYDYGQKNKFELTALEKTINKLGIKKHIIIKIDPTIFGKSALTCKDVVVPEHDIKDIGKNIPVTYVPARNTIFLSYCLGLAEVNDINEIYIGVNALDYSGYPDCRKEYIEAYEKMANLALASSANNGRNIFIKTPLIDKNKKEIIEMGLAAGADYSYSVSCYDPRIDEEVIYSCGKCDACKLRLKGFKEAGFKDPIKYDFKM